MDRGFKAFFRRLKSGQKPKCPHTICGTKGPLSFPGYSFNPKTKKPPVSIFYAWDTIRKRVGIPEVRLHDLLHSYASFLVNAGRSLYEVQKLLGHHDPKVTMRYAHLSSGALIDAANVAGKVVKGRRKT